MQDEAVSPDGTQPYHRVDGKLLDQREWREKLITCTELFDEFKRQAYKDKEI
jgi:predicted HAD superfamily Cof-like phosphohydrolase